jgi:hypothetical protein
MIDCLLGEFLYAMDDGVNCSFPKVLIFIHRLVSFGDNLWRQPLATTFGDNLWTQGWLQVISGSPFYTTFLFFLLLFFSDRKSLLSFSFFVIIFPFNKSRTLHIIIIY